MVVVNPAKKPLIMFHLVHAHSVKNALVFTKSAESTTRLLRLFEFFESARLSQTKGSESDRIIARAYSSDSPSSERKSILEDFKAQKIHMYVQNGAIDARSNVLNLYYSLICSDLISRGIDISHVAHVVSYDAPVDIRKYVHRVGRTARAGRAGDAWTLVEEQEVMISPMSPFVKLFDADVPDQAHHFKKMLRDSDHLDNLQRLKIQDTAIAASEPYYEVRPQLYTGPD